MLDDSADTISNPSTARPSRPSLFLSRRSSLSVSSSLSSSFFLSLSLTRSLCLSLILPCRPTLCSSLFLFYSYLFRAPWPNWSPRSILRTIGLIGNRERDEDQAEQISRLILIGPLCCCHDEASRASEAYALAADSDTVRIGTNASVFSEREPSSPLHLDKTIKGSRRWR